MCTSVSLPRTIFGLLNHLTTFFLLQRINIPEILQDEWFKKDYRPPEFDEVQSLNADDVEAVFKDSEASTCTEHRVMEQPTPLNAFELISMSQGLNLGNLFGVEQVCG